MVTATRTFARRMAIAFAASVLLTAFTGLIAILTMHSIADRVDELQSEAAGPLLLGERLRTEALREQGAHARYLANKDPVYLRERNQAHLDFSDQLRRLRPQATDAESARLLAQIERAEREQTRTFDDAIAGPVDPARILGVQRGLNAALDVFVDHARGIEQQARQGAIRAAQRSRRIVDLVAGATMLLAAGIALLLARRFIREYEQAQQAIRAREQFLSIASQELSRPLSSLAHQLEPLRRASHERSAAEATQPDLLDRRLDQAQLQLGRMTALVNELLDATRLQSGRVQLVREPVDLALLVRQVARRLERTAAASGTPLDVHAATRVVGQWDRLRLEQVVEELLTNAMRHGHGKLVRVTVEGGDPARLVVRDHGTGIKREQQSHLFEPYEAATQLHQEGGLGLGLYIVHELVHAHGGRIQVQSTPQVGSTFVVELPRRPVVPAPPRRWPKVPWQQAPGEGPAPR